MQQKSVAEILEEYNAQLIEINTRIKEMQRIKKIEFDPKRYRNLINIRTSLKYSINEMQKYKG
jgi:hypothetical protein